MTKYYLAIDLGASSGRHILAHLENSKIILEEMHRFDNNVVERDGRLCWNLDDIFSEIITGMKKCAAAGKIPYSMGIDTWGVDFVLLDKNDNIIGDTVAYRDSRTEGMEEAVREVISDDDLYRRTGIQYHSFNTIYQLYAIKQQNPEWLEAAETLLFVPDYLHFLLTGAKTNEYTECTTSGLIDARTREFDKELLDMLGIKPSIFQEVKQPGTLMGSLTDEVKAAVGFDVKVVIPATHDTASAVAALPGNDDNRIFISSGTWSLLGTEIFEPNTTPAARISGYTNEGGVLGSYRFLSNIMGLWMIQSIRRNLNKAYSFDELEQMARKNAAIPTIIDVDDECFLFPKNMIDAVNDQCEKSGFPRPKNIGETVAVVYNSLAAKYDKCVKALEALSGRTFEVINIIGGGCKDGYLCELTAKYTGKTVFAGPSEATSLGNITVQLLADGAAESLGAARDMIKDSFDIKKV